MNKTEQRESAPKFKAEGGDFFKAGNYDKAGESYEKALKCIGRFYPGNPRLKFPQLRQLSYL